MQVSIGKVKAKFYDKSKDSLSSHAGKICQGSNDNNPFVKLEIGDKNFRGERGFTVPDFPEDKGFYRVESSDGLGTKPEFADASEDYTTIAGDLVAMCVDDIARFGGLALLLSNVLIVGSVDNEKQEKSFKDLLDGLAKYSKEQDLVLIEGETAFHGASMISPIADSNFHFDWSGTAHGINHKDMRITGENIKPGDLLIALQQDGFGCNGISLVRKAFSLKYGKNWFRDAPREEILEALAPSKIYAKAIAEANGWYNNCEKQVELHAVAHLSGGSYESKFYEPLLQKNGFSAVLDNLFPLPEIAKKASKWLREAGEDFPVTEMLKTWSCGQRMIIAVPDQANADKFIEICQKYSINAQVAGKVTETPAGETPELIIKSSDLDEIY